MVARKHPRSDNVVIASATALLAPVACIAISKSTHWVYQLHAIKGLHTEQMTCLLMWLPCTVVAAAMTNCSKPHVPHTAHIARYDANAPTTSRQQSDSAHAIHPSSAACPPAISTSAAEMHAPSHSGQVDQAPAKASTAAALGKSLLVANLRARMLAAQARL